MKQIKQIESDSKITPNQGIGGVKLGMNSFYLRDLYGKNFQNSGGAYHVDFDKSEWSSELCKPFFGSLILKYKDFLKITINLFNGAISHLRVQNDFKGKVDGIVGIGDSMREYYLKNSDLLCEFDGGVFFLLDR